MSRKEINLYVFIGDTDNVISKILNKIEAIEKLTPEDLKLLKSLYKNSYLRWISKSKINPIKFINYKIELEDSIRIIKNKIFLYLSSNKNKRYLLQKNQEIMG